MCGITVQVLLAVFLMDNYGKCDKLHLYVPDNTFSILFYTNLIRGTSSALEKAEVVEPQVRSEHRKIMSQKRANRDIGTKVSVNTQTYMFITVEMLKTSKFVGGLCPEF